MATLHSVRASKKSDFHPETETHASHPHDRRLQETLARLRNVRLSYRFYILTFSEGLSEEALAGVLDTLHSQGYVIRLQGFSLGLLDVGESALQREGFAQIIQNELARHAHDRSWQPFVVDCIEGRTDEISTVTDLILMAADSREQKNQRKANTACQKTSGLNALALG